MTTQKRKTNKLQLVVDFGGSLTKIIGGTTFSQRLALAMEPDVIQIPVGLVQEQNYLTGANLSDRAWVGWDNQIYAVGYYARTCSIANPQLSKLKREIAVYKVAAAIWVMQQTFKLPSHIELNLGCLLPVGEYEDRSKLAEGLEQQLKEFSTPTGVINVQLTLFDCKPEGGGLTIRHQHKRGKEMINQIHLAVMMVGYRNTSLMLFKRGIRHDSRLSPLGFARLVNHVVSKTSGQSLERLTPIVAQYLAHQDPQILNAVLLSEDTHYEIQQIQTAIAQATEQYHLELSNWLTENLPNSVDEVVLSGGTADLFKAFFVKQLQGKRIYLHANIDLPDDLLALNLGHRFADVWILWEFLSQKVKNNLTPQAA